MEIKETEMDKDLQEQLKDIRDNINKLMVVIGQDEIKRRQFEEQLNSIKGNLSHYYNLHKKYNAELQSQLNKIEEEYPSAEVDVDKGIIYHE